MVLNEAGCLTEPNVFLANMHGYIKVTKHTKAMHKQADKSWQKVVLADLL